MTNLTTLSVAIGIETHTTATFGVDHHAQIMQTHRSTHIVVDIDRCETRGLIRFCRRSITNRARAATSP
ncbi:hypothetical protein [Sphingobium yanoikuyae]|uniref:hypothetical protein n=1 Tax=Sphingobium yanoikuyae TaxID=13690 RepID=UPI000A5F4C09|nr:hypothetical protein [Sphingobium yanoikuyae]